MIKLQIFILTVKIHHKLHLQCRFLNHEHLTCTEYAEFWLRLKLSTIAWMVPHETDRKTIRIVVTYGISFRNSLGIREKKEILHYNLEFFQICLLWLKTKLRTNNVACSLKIYLHWHLHQQIVLKRQFLFSSLFLKWQGKMIQFQSSSDYDFTTVPDLKV